MYTIYKSKWRFIPNELERCQTWTSSEKPFNEFIDKNSKQTKSVPFNNCRQSQKRYCVEIYAISMYT
jgi:hypothetical protein